MSSKVTMQDIADALNLSRNTVSKAINNTGVIAESTKKLILQKAVEMGYRNHSGVGRTYGPGHVKQDSGVDVSKKEIAMLTSSMPGGSHFAVTTLDRMQQIFSSNGYSLTYYRITKEELESLNLPGTLNLKATAAMFCMELFHYDYCRMLADTGVPLLLIDGPALFDKEPLPADMLIMENCASIHYFVRMLAQKGKRSVGFIGNILHCQSFFERWGACATAASVNGFPSAEKYSVLHYSPGTDSGRSISYRDSSDDLFDKLEKLPELPDAFICANDFIAITLISALRRMNLRCPEDILVLGFDDSPESRFHSPSLSTVHIHTQAMGRLAAELILGRIADPGRDFRGTYSMTELILRESSEI